VAAVYRIPQTRLNSDTDMFHYMKDTMIKTGTDTEMWENMKPLDPNYSANVLMDFLKKDEFENGKHIDIYDITNP